MDEIQTIYRKGYDIGVGTVMASGSPKSLSVVGEITHVHNAPGTGGLFAYNEIKSTEELENSLGISAEAGGGVGLQWCRISSASVIARHRLRRRPVV